jgi:hypothetical protein
MFTCECVHRRFRYRTYAPGRFSLIIDPAYKRLMKIVVKAISQNKEVDFKHEIVVKAENGIYKWQDGNWYDKVKVTIK